MGFLSPPKPPPYIPPPPPPAPPPPPPPKAKLDSDLPQTDEEVSARAKAAQEALENKKRRIGISGLTIPQTTQSGLNVTTPTNTTPGSST